MFNLKIRYLGAENDMTAYAHSLPEYWIAAFMP
jgi:hypothetical protein